MFVIFIKQIPFYIFRLIKGVCTNFLLNNNKVQVVLLVMVDFENCLGSSMSSNVTFLRVLVHVMDEE